MHISSPCWDTDYFIGGFVVLPIPWQYPEIYHDHFLRSSFTFTKHDYISLLCNWSVSLNSLQSIQPHNFFC